MSIRLFRLYVKVPVVLLALIEGSLLLFAPYLAAAIRFDGNLPDWATPPSGLLVPAALFAFYGLGSLFAVGLYSTRQRTSAASGGIFACRRCGDHSVRCARDRLA